MTLKFGGRLELKSLERAIREILRRQESLRTVITLNASKSAAGQTVTEVPEQLWEVQDLHALPGAERDSELERIQRDMMERPWELTQVPFRAKLVKLGPQSHNLYLAAHPLLLDDQSWQIFCQEPTFNLLLSRWCGQNQMLLWIVDAHRQHRELTKVIGNFLTFQPIVTDSSCTKTFAELLTQVQQASTEARANSDVPGLLFMQDPVLLRLVYLPMVVFN